MLRAVPAGCGAMLTRHEEAASKFMSRRGEMMWLHAYSGTGSLNSKQIGPAREGKPVRVEGSTVAS